MARARTDSLNDGAGISVSVTNSETKWSKFAIQVLERRFHVGTLQEIGLRGQERGRKETSWREERQLPNNGLRGTRAVERMCHSGALEFHKSTIISSTMLHSKRGTPASQRTSPLTPDCLPVFPWC